MIRLTARLAALLTAASLMLGVIGCGRAQQEEPGKNEPPEQQQQRKEKAGN